jgi:hypothetical protein
MNNYIKSETVHGKSFTRRFYKENGLWYIDLPEFIENGFGTKANLLMVDGSDKLLDILSRNTGECTIRFKDHDIYSPGEATSHSAIMQIAEEGMNQDILTSVGHAPIQYGRYYHTTAIVDDKRHDMKAWLCPVAEWVFGHYPKTIYVDVINYGPQESIEEPEELQMDFAFPILLLVSLLLGIIGCYYWFKP